MIGKLLQIEGSSFKVLRNAGKIVGLSIEGRIGFRSLSNQCINVMHIARDDMHGFFHASQRTQKIFIVLVLLVLVLLIFIEVFIVQILKILLVLLIFVAIFIFC